MLTERGHHIPRRVTGEGFGEETESGSKGKAEAVALLGFLRERQSKAG